MRLTIPLLACLAVLMSPLGPGVAQTTQPAPSPLIAAPTTQPVTTGPTDVLEAIPADAWAFLVVKNMDALSSEIARLGQQLGLPIPPMLPMLKGLTGLLVGIEDAGNFAVVLMDTTKFSPPVALLLPVTNLQMLLQPLAPEDAGDLVQLIQLMGKPTFVVPYGRYAVLAPSKELSLHMLRPTPGVRSKLDESRLESYEKANLFAHVDLVAVLKEYKPVIDQMLEANVPPEARPGLVNLIEMLQQISTGDLAVGLDSGGLAIRIFASFLPGTDLAQQVAAQPLTDKSLLIGLPAQGEQYIFAAGQTFPDAKLSQASRAKSLDTVFENPQVKPLLDPAKAQQLKTALLDLTGMARQASVSFGALPAGPDGLIGVTVVLRVSDPAATMKALRDTFTTLKTAFVDEQIQPVFQHLLYKPEAEQLADLTVDHLIVDLSTAEDVTQDAQNDIKKVAGQEGLLVRIAPVGKEYVVAAFGGGPKRFTTVVGLVKQGGTPLATEPTIARAATKLAARKSAELYFALDNLLLMIKNVGSAVEQPVPFQLTPINASLGISSSTLKDSTRIDVFVPMELIVGVKDLIIQAMGAPPEAPEEPTTMPARPPTTMPAPPAPTF